MITESAEDREVRLERGRERLAAEPRQARLQSANQLATESA